MITVQYGDVHDDNHKCAVKLTQIKLEKMGKGDFSMQLLQGANKKGQIYKNMSHDHALMSFIPELLPP